MKPERKAEIRAAAAAATPGPWRTDRTGKTVSGFTCDIVIAAVAPRQAIYCTPEGGTFPEADRRFIALAREAVPDLLAEVDRLEADVARMQMLLDGIEDAWDSLGQLTAETLDSGRIVLDHLEPAVSEIYREVPA